MDCCLTAPAHYLKQCSRISKDPSHPNIPDSKVHGVDIGPTWVLSAPDGPNVGPMNLAIRDIDMHNGLAFSPIAGIELNYYTTLYVPIWFQLIGITILCFTQELELIPR